MTNSATQQTKRITVNFGGGYVHVANDARLLAITL